MRVELTVDFEDNTGLHTRHAVSTGTPLNPDMFWYLIIRLIRELIRDWAFCKEPQAANEKLPYRWRQLADLWSEPIDNMIRAARKNNPAEGMDS